MKRCTEIATEVHFRASRQRRSSERESVTLILEVPSFLFSYRAVRGVFLHSATSVTKRGVSLSFGDLEIRYRVFALVRINIRGEISNDIEIKSRRNFPYDSRTNLVLLGLKATDLQGIDHS